MLEPCSSASEPGAIVENFADATDSDTQALRQILPRHADNGVYLPPSQYEAWFVGLAHSEDVIQQTLDAAKRASRLPINRDDDFS